MSKRLNPEESQPRRESSQKKIKSKLSIKSYMNHCFHCIIYTNRVYFFFVQFVKIGVDFGSDQFQQNVIISLIVRTEIVKNDNENEMKLYFGSEMCFYKLSLPTQIQPTRMKKHLTEKLSGLEKNLDFARIFNFRQFFTEFSNFVQNFKLDPISI